MVIFPALVFSQAGNHVVDYETIINFKASLNVDLPVDFKIKMNYTDSLLYKTGVKENIIYGTESFLAYNRIPPRCMNDVGLIIEKKREGWVDLNSKTSSIDIKQIGMVIDPEKKMANTLVNIQSTELDSYHLKNTFRNDSSLFKKHLNEKGFLNVNDIKMLNIDQNSNPYLITFKADLPVDYFDDKLIVSPFLGLPDKENKLKQPARTYPVDFIYAKKEEYLATIKIPDGYRVFSLPDKVDVKNDMLDIFASYVQDGEIIELKAYYHRKKGIYPPNEYKQIKNHLDVLEKVFSEQLVFVKE